MGIGKSKIIKYDYQLCDELIEEILFRLPLRYLINCRYVSKSWSSLVSNVLAIHRRRFSPSLCSIGLHSTFLPPSSGVQGELRVLYHSEAAAADCYYVGKGVHIPWFRKLLVAHSHPETAATAASKEEDTIMMDVAKYMNLYCDTELLDSCNGLLFLRCCSSSSSSSSSSVAAAGHVVVYYVCNPVLDQWAVLPDHYQQYYPKKKIVSVFFDADDDNALDLDYCFSCILGFAFDGIQGHHYTVVSFTWQPAAASTDDDDDTLISCEIFSSETGRWRDHRAPILNSLTSSSSSSLHDGIGIKKGSPIKKRSLYWKGAIHWLFVLDNRYMLLFYLDKEVFEFIKLPHRGHIDDYPTPGNGRVVKFLWESDKGCLHYCSNAFSGDNCEFHVWTYLEDDDCSSSSNEQRWVLKQTVKLIVMSPLIIENPFKIMICMYSSSSSINDNGTTTTTVIVPCGWFRDMQTAYIQTMLTVFFNGGFERKRQVVCWSCDNMFRSIRRKTEKEGYYSLVQHPLEGALYPYLFNLVELPTWDGCRLLRQPDRRIN